jgi:hypothetical protein
MRRRHRWSTRDSTAESLQSAWRCALCPSTSIIMNQGIAHILKSSMPCIMQVPNSLYTWLAPRINLLTVEYVAVPDLSQQSVTSSSWKSRTGALAD